MRSLYGLLLTCTQLAASPKCQQAKKKDYAKVRYEKNICLGVCRKYFSNLNIKKGILLI
jgi:hypothetical protein